MQFWSQEGFVFQRDASEENPKQGKHNLCYVS